MNIEKLITEGGTVTVPLHVEKDHRGTRWSWGDPVVGIAAGPEGYLVLGLDGEGNLVIDEHDEDICPPVLHGRPYRGAGSIVDED